MLKASKQNKTHKPENVGNFKKPDSERKGRLSAVFLVWVHLLDKEIGLKKDEGLGVSVWHSRNQDWFYWKKKYASLFLVVQGISVFSV